MKERDQNGWLLCLNSEMRYHCKMGGVGDFFCQAVWMEGRWVCEVFILVTSEMYKKDIHLPSIPLAPLLSHLFVNSYTVRVGCEEFLSSVRTRCNLR
jgi:hypothetical protein